MHLSTWIRGRNVGLVAIVLVLMIALATWAIVKIFIPAAPTSADGLAVSPGDVLPQEALCESDEFIPNSLPSTALVWSDSVSTPFKAKTPKGMFKEILAEDCGNPTVLMMNIEGLSAISIEKDTTIGDVNPWMAEFVKTKNLSGFLSADKGHVTPAFQQVAELTNTVLLRLKVVGVSSDLSLENWHVAAREGLAAGALPVATLNDAQEALPALRLEYTMKGQECPAFAVGFNTADKRFEVLPLSCGTPPTTPPGANPSCPPETPHGTWPVCKDSPNRDPEVQGHNKPGGGGLAPVQEDHVGPPAAGDPPATYTPAPTPSPSTPPVDSTPVPSPAPTPPPNEGGDGNTGDDGGF